MATLKRLLLLLPLLAGWACPVFADMVFPARLSLDETEAGLFQVQFNLPVQNMARVKALPVLPSTCEVLTPLQESFTQSRYEAEWQVRCAAGELAGQTVGVDGLLGTQIDVMLSITTMDGRNYSNVLKPARARYVIPEPPSVWQAAASGFVEGLRGVFERVDVYLLLWLLVLGGLRGRSAAGALVTAAMVCAVGQELARSNLLLLPASLPLVMILLLTVFFAIRIGAAGHAGQQRLPAWLAGGWIGAVYGAALQGFQPAAEFSRLEHASASMAHAVGILAGLVVIFLLCVEFAQVLRQFGKRTDEADRRRLLGKLTGIAAVGVLLYQLTAFSLLATLVPSAPALLLLVAVTLGIYVGRLAGGTTLYWLVAALLLLAGFKTGSMGHSLPYASVIGPLALFALGAALVLKRQLPNLFALGVLAIAVFYSAAQAGLLIQENLSMPVAQMAGSGVLAACLALAAFSVSGPHQAGFSRLTRMAGLTAVAVAMLVWGEAYASWFQATIVTDYALGMLQIPLLSLALILMAMFAWPRRSKVAAILTSDQRKPTGHLVLLVLSVFLLGTATVQVRNPFFEQLAPGPEQARRVLEKVLGNTYGAFNLEDEDELYQQLSLSVTDELIEDLYLDSRRRLTSGVRQGSEVTVKDVSVLEVRVPETPGSPVSNQFAYDVKWVVTARVRHLQHVHHRKNLYTGALTVEVVNGKWKVRQVDLKSEERTIVPRGSA